MAKSTVTRIVALESALTCMQAQGADPAAIQVVEKMLTQLRAPRKPSNKPSKTAAENSALAAKVVELMVASGKPFTTKDIVSVVPEIATSQKAVAVMKAAIANGTVAKMKIGSQTLYTLA